MIPRISTFAISSGEPGWQVWSAPHVAMPVQMLPPQSPSVTQQPGIGSPMHPIPWSQKSTVQGEFEHAGSNRLRRPPDTDCVTTGGESIPWSYPIVSVTWTWSTCADVTCTWPP